MPKVIAYTYGAAVHCPECAKAALADGALVPAADYHDLPPGADEHDVPYALQDGEGSPIRPIYSTDDTPAEGLRCDTCGAEIAAPDPERAIHEALEEDDPIAAVFQLMKRGVVDERDVGNFIVDSADGTWYHPNDGICEGFAYIDVGGGRAITAAWDNYGFWHVQEMTVEEADAEIAAREAECKEAED